MIRLRIQGSKIAGNMVPKTYLTCPQCRSVDWYYTMIPEACEECGFRWGLVRKLEHIGVRKYYHRKGEID